MGAKLLNLVPGAGLEPARTLPGPRDFKSTIYYLQQTLAGRKALYQRALLRSYGVFLPIAAAWLSYSVSYRDPVKFWIARVYRSGQQFRSQQSNEEFQLKSKAEIQVANFFNRATDILLQKFAYLFAEGGVTERKISGISCTIQDHCNGYFVKNVTTVIDLFQDTDFAAQRFLVTRCDPPPRRPITNASMTHQRVVPKLH
jgi:hypothetical protein